MPAIDELLSVTYAGLGMDTPEPEQPNVFDSLPELPKPTEEEDKKLADVTFMGKQPEPDDSPLKEASNQLIRGLIEDNNRVPEIAPIVTDEERATLLEPIDLEEGAGGPQEPSVPSRRASGSNDPYLPGRVSIPEQGQSPAEQGDKNEKVLQVLEEIRDGGEQDQEVLEAIAETLEAIREGIGDVGKLGA